MHYKGKDRLCGMIEYFGECLLFIFREVLQNVIGRLHPARRAADAEPQTRNILCSQLLQNGRQAALTARSAGGADALPLEFGHSLTDLLGGQCSAGFMITDLYEDVMLDSPLGKYHPNYIATRAVKP